MSELCEVPHSTENVVSESVQRAHSNIKGMGQARLSQKKILNTHSTHIEYTLGSFCSSWIIPITI